MRAYPGTFPSELGMPRGNWLARPEPSMPRRPGIDRQIRLYKRRSAVITRPRFVAGAVSWDNPDCLECCYCSEIFDPVRRVQGHSPAITRHPIVDQHPQMRPSRGGNSAIEDMAAFVRITDPSAPLCGDAVRAADVLEAHSGQPLRLSFSAPDRPARFAMCSSRLATANPECQANSSC